MSTGSPSPDRIVTLDIIRGVAVMGIFSVNVVAFAMIEAAYFNPAAYGGTSGADLVVWAANLLLIDGKMRTLFSMLFGASMLLVMERAEAAGKSPGDVHLLRMLVLLGIGLVHYYALWYGDILTLYAVCGLLAMALFRHSVRGLMVRGIVAILFGMAIFGAIVAFSHGERAAAFAPGAPAEAMAAWQSGLGSLAPSPTEIAADKALHLSGWWPITADKLNRIGALIAGTLFLLPETLGLMLLGMAGYRSGFLTGQWEDARYRRFAAVTLGLGAAAFGLLIAADIASGFDVLVQFGGFTVATTPFRVAMAAGYAALIILLTRRQGWLATRIAATGRMAFSNYLGTSLVATAVFYGWGLGLYGSVSRAQAWLLVPAVWIAMLAWSKPWLDHFHYGPMEWLWRSAARGRLQPIRRQIRPKS